MIASTIRILALTACIFVGLSTAMFVAEQVGEASDNTVVAITDDGEREQVGNINLPAPDPDVEERREAEHGPFREFVDDVNDVLLAPFADLIDSDNIWVQRLFATAMALLLYGGVLLFLARAAGMKKKPKSGQMYDPRKAARGDYQ